MGCHTWTWKNKTALRNRNYDSTEHDFLFRVFDYQEDILTSYEEAEKFVLETLKKSTNNKPKIKNKNLTYTGEMKGKILLADETGDDSYEELKDPSVTLKRLKEFFNKYPKGIITFG